MSNTLVRLVVLVDDDSRVRESMESLLTSKAIPVQSFEHATDAFHFLGRERVGCVITDLALSGMGGWELQRLIAKTYPDLPVIVVTGRNGHNWAHAVSHGAFAFLFKPFDVDELIVTVKRALAQCADSLATRLPSFPE